MLSTAQTNLVLGTSAAKGLYSHQSVITYQPYLPIEPLKVKTMVKPCTCSVDRPALDLKVIIEYLNQALNILENPPEYVYKSINRTRRFPIKYGPYWTRFCGSHLEMYSGAMLHYQDKGEILSMSSLLTPREIFLYSLLYRDGARHVWDCCEPHYKYTASALSQINLKLPEEYNLLYPAHDPATKEVQSASFLLENPNSLLQAIINLNIVST